MGRPVRLRHLAKNLFTGYWPADVESLNSESLSNFLVQAERMALVLCTGVNPPLIETRRLLLERAGHTVVTAMDEDALVAACQQHAFDIVVIGQTVSPMEKKRVFALIREHRPTAMVLELHPFYLSRVLEDADGWLAVPAEVPQQLADSVAALAAKRTA